MPAKRIGGLVLRGAIAAALALLPAGPASPDEADPAGPAPANFLVAKVAGKRIYFSDIQRVAQRLEKPLQEKFRGDPDWRAGFIRNYVAQVALAQMAERQKLDRQPSVVLSLDLARRRILSDALIQSRLDALSVAEEELKVYYEQNMQRYMLGKKVQPFSEVRAKVGQEYAGELRERAVSDLIREALLQAETEFDEGRVQERIRPPQ